MGEAAMGRFRARAHDEGFTLIELLVVVIIIGILAAIAIPVFLNQREKARNAAARSDLRNLVTAQEAYMTGSTDTQYTADGPSLVQEGAGLSPGVQHAVCTTDGGDNYGLVSLFDGNEVAYFYDSEQSVIVVVNPVTPGDSAADILAGAVPCDASPGNF